MAYGELKKIDPKVAAQQVEIYRETQKRHVELIKIMHDALQPFEGKAFSKRMATAVNKALPECKVHWNPNYNMYHIEVIEHDIHIDSLIGYGGYGAEPTFSIKKFVEYNQCYYLDEGRREALGKIAPDADKDAAEWNQAIAVVNALHNKYYDHYPLSQYFTTRRD